MSYTKQTWETGDVITVNKLGHVEEGIRGINESYQEQTWQTGDVITAEKLNHIEDGIANAGGGGSSDFSTAEVTVVNNVPEVFTWEVPFIVDEDEFSYAIGNLSVPLGAAATYTIILYKGEALTRFPVNGHSIAVEGDIEDDGDDYYIISGDCTITIRPTE